MNIENLEADFLLLPFVESLCRLGACDRAGPSRLAPEDPPFQVVSSPWAVALDQTAPVSYPAVSTRLRGSETLGKEVTFLPTFWRPPICVFPLEVAAAGVLRSARPAPCLGYPAAQHCSADRAVCPTGLRWIF